MTAPQSELRGFSLVRNLVQHRELGILLAILAIQAGLIAYAATIHSPTDLEPATLASGIAHWHLGRFDAYQVNPPLVRLTAAIPIIISGCGTDWSRLHDSVGTRSEFSVGQDFIKANGKGSVPIFIFARWACIPFILLGSYAAFRWAKELYGCHAGFMTLILFAFDPNIIAHGELITPDAASTSFGIAANYVFWKWLKRPKWKSACITGIILGLAELSKTTWIILFFVWPTIWLSRRLLPAKRNLPENAESNNTNPPFAQLVVILLISIYVINLVYLFDGTGTRIKDFCFVSHTLSENKLGGDDSEHLAKSWISNIPVPLPKQYLIGLDYQIKDFEEYRFKSYLRGEWRRRGWWYYYLYGLAVKAPVGTWCILALVFISRLHSSTLRPLIRDEITIIVPAVLIIAIASSQTSLNIHFRYVLPAYGLLFVFLGQSAVLMTSKSLVRKFCVSGAAIFSITSSAISYPHQISYFNEFAGGPAAGYRHLLGSSVDWGQDSWLVQNWAANRIEAGDLVKFHRRPDIVLPELQNLGRSSRSSGHYWYIDSVNSMDFIDFKKYGISLAEVPQVSSGRIDYGFERIGYTHIAYSMKVAMNEDLLK